MKNRMSVASLLILLLPSMPSPALSSVRSQTATPVTPAAYTRIEGTVYLRDNGTESFVPNALVEIYMLSPFKKRMEMRTSRRGFYTQNGILKDGKYLIIVSGSGIEPTSVNNIEPHIENTINIYVRPGDGSHPTLDQVLSRPSNPTATPSAEPQWRSLSRVKTAVPEAGPSGIEDARKNYDVQTEADVETLARFDQAASQYRRGVESLKKEDYRLAVVELEQAAAAIPLPVPPAFADLFVKLNLALAEARYGRGVALYNEAARDEARAWLERAVAATLRVIKSGLARAEARDDLIACYDILVKNVIILTEQFGLSDHSDDALKALDQAQVIDAASKGRWATAKGKLLVLLGQTDDAADVFEKVFAYDPKNLDAVYGMSLIYGLSTDRGKLQKANYYISDFIARAPATDSRVQEMKVLLEAIKAQLGAAETSSSGKKP